MKLGYRVVEEARNFQFEKAIPDSAEIVRVEFMGPDEHKRQDEQCGITQWRQG
jgi:hypothetical protein